MKKSLANKLSDEIIKEFESLAREFFEDSLRGELKGTQVEDRIREILMQISSKLCEKYVELKDGGKDSGKRPRECGGGKKFEV